MSVDRLTGSRLSQIRLCLILACILGWMPATAVRPESTKEYDNLIQSRNQEIQRLKNEREDTLVVIDRFNERETRVLELLKVLSSNIKSTEAQLARITENIEKTQGDIEETNRLIETLQAQITSDKEEINKQLKALFYVNKAKSMTLFIGVNSFKHYFRNQKLLKYSTQLDLKVLERYTDNLAQLQREQEKLELQTAELERLRVREKEQKTLLEFERRQQVTYLQHLRDDHTSQIKYLREIQVELERLNDTLYSLEVKKQNQRRIEKFQGLYKLENSLPKPVDGVLIHRFGQEQSPFYTLFRRGVLVETSTNAEVRSVLAGKVAWSGPFRGYQNLVILDHGKGSFSVYGNMEDVYVLVDDVINQGELLGTVAKDDLEDKYLFYFEIRYNKRAVNPMKWLKKPAW